LMSFRFWPGAVFHASCPAGRPEHPSLDATHQALRRLSDSRKDIQSGGASHAAVRALASRACFAAIVRR
jgi:hypothetical protein